MHKLLLLIIVVAGITSCQKEIIDNIDSGNNGNTGGDTATNALIGTWVFDSATLQSNTRSETMIDGEDDVTISSYTYTTQGNNGILKISDSVFSLTDYTYSVSTTINGLLYQNGVFIDSFPTPFNYYQPPVNISAKYQLISSDSLYFPDGGLTTDTSNHQPAGAGFIISDKQLTIRQQSTIDITDDNSGYPTHETGTSLSKSYYHKN